MDSHAARPSRARAIYDQALRDLPSHLSSRDRDPARPYKVGREHYAVPDALAELVNKQLGRRAGDAAGSLVVSRFFSVGGMHESGAGHTLAAQPILNPPRLGSPFQVVQRGEAERPQQPVLQGPPPMVVNPPFRPQPLPHRDTTNALRYHDPVSLVFPLLP
ncbi:hypothetical protein JCM6882_007958 [Rhodosporidiobolus microsporus]